MRTNPGGAIASIAFAFVIGIMVACGQKDETVTEPAPAAPGQVPSADQVEALVAKDCGGCHNGTKEPSLAPASTFKASQAKAELLAGTMPPAPATISAADKAELLSFLEAP